MSLYLEATTILTTSSGSLKSRIFQGAWKSPANRLYALIVETLKHQALLAEILSASGLLTHERKLNHPLALLLLHDHLLTKNGIATSSGPLKDAVLRHKARLAAELTRARIRRGFGSVAEMLNAAAGAAGRLVRWVRVNALVSSVSEVVRTLGCERVDTLDALLAPGAGGVYYEDPYVRDLLAFPPAVEFMKHQLYLDGAIILQDRASCFPAEMLAPEIGGTVLDATAAPGNKTTQLAALVGGEGRVLAFERDERRAVTLRKMVAKARAGGIVDVRAGQDFLATRPEEEEEGLREVRWILLDPSCSGSGIVGREEVDLIPLPVVAPEKGRKGRKRKMQTQEVMEVKEGKDTERLKALSEFQQKMILHAMTFPAARYISYSTCSIHREENEDVVTAVLASKVARRRGWSVKAGLMPKWERRGVAEFCSTEEVAKACIRCNPVEDGGIGFFVAVFERDLTKDGVGEDGLDYRDDEKSGEEEYEEWNGFGEEDEIPSMEALPPNPLKKRKKNKSAKNKK